MNQSHTRFIIKAIYIDAATATYTGCPIYWIITTSLGVPVGNPIYSFKDALAIREWISTVSSQMLIEDNQILKLTKKNK